MTQTQAIVRIVGPNEGQPVSLLGAPVTVKSNGGEGRLFVADHVVPPGYMTPPHRHTHEDEMFYVLSGEILLASDEGEARAPAGTFAYFPRGTRHSFRNVSGREARMLVVTSEGANFANFVQALDAAEAQAGELNPDRVVEICTAHDITVG